MVRTPRAVVRVVQVRAGGTVTLHSATSRPNSESNRQTPPCMNRSSILSTSPYHHLSLSLDTHRTPHSSQVAEFALQTKALRDYSVMGVGKWWLAVFAGVLLFNSASSVLLTRPRNVCELTLSCGVPPSTLILCYVYVLCV